MSRTMKVFLMMLLFAFCFASQAQKLSQIDSILRKQFPTNSRDDWHYYPYWGKLTRLQRPQLTRIIPHLQFYRANFTNTVCWPEESLCLLTYNANTKSVELIEPIWYSNETIDFLRTFVGAAFADSATLKKFVTEIQSLIDMDSDYPSRNTKYSSNSISFDVFNLAIGGRIWRRYEIQMNNMTFKALLSKPRE